ncbi:hypothetical protein B0H66DRAFT_602356 [Apodospora peruviana]|uniref:Uncharacterized protein n=1 Tax=Apodospora peruviana TaxID=516989 RepID=A0AAE0IDU6_9PEZI|nr:hypothetical protein B0H66DRAFT_602356 [Apodospora peruviana]
MRSTTILVALTAYISAAAAAPSNVVPRADAPCDAWSDECREVITGNACFAAYITGTNKSQVLDCVDVEDHAVSERKICNCYGCAETTVQQWAIDNLQCAP